MAPNGSQIKGQLLFINIYAPFCFLSLTSEKYAHKFLLKVILLAEYLEISPHGGEESVNSEVK